MAEFVCVKHLYKPSSILNIRNNVKKSNDHLDLDELRLRLRPETEYQEKYKALGFEPTCSAYKRSPAAGVSLKALTPDYKDEELPRFLGESISKSAHCPQPQVANWHPKKSPTNDTGSRPSNRSSLFGDVASEPFRAIPISHSVYCPPPQDLVEQVKDKVRSKTPDCRWKKGAWTDLVSSYLADYCETQTKVKRLCLTKDCKAGGDNLDNQKRTSLMQADPVSDWLNSLHYRTTYGVTYQPPSAFGGVCCHPVKYLREDS